MGCAGPPPASPPPPPLIQDLFRFQVQTRELKPVAGATIQVAVEAGRALDPLPLTTDGSGRADLRVEAQTRPMVKVKRTTDRHLGFRSVLNYEVRAPGFLPVWGRVELTDALEEFSRPGFAEALNSRPRDKSRTIRQLLFREEDFFEPGSLKDPLARTVAAGLSALWRSWSLAGRLEQIQPTPESWKIIQRPEGPFLQAGLEVPACLQEISDKAVHEAFETELIPILDDLAGLYAPLLAGWDLTFNLGLQSVKDPHAMPELHPLRLVFSETYRTELINRPGGLNWLIPLAKECTLDGKPWQPVKTLDRLDLRYGYLRRTMSPFFAPGPNQIIEEDQAQK